jgi:hypothetical protein
VTSVRFELEAVETGRWILEPVEIVNRSDTIRTEPVVFSVRTASGVLPLRAVWSVNADRVYQNQSVVMELVVLNGESTVFPREIEAAAPEQGVLEHVPGVGSITSRSLGDQVLYNTPIRTYLFTPSGTGSVVIPAADITLNEGSVVSGPFEMDVLPVPGSAGYSGGVGNFRYSVEVSRSRIRLGDTVDLQIRVEGVGNLGHLNMPGFNSAEFVVEDLPEIHRITVDHNGPSGYRASRYRLTPKRAGEFFLDLPEFVWFDPEQRRIVRADAPDVHLEVLEQAQTLRSDLSGGPANDIGVLSLEEVRQLSGRYLYKQPAQYLWLLPGPLIAFIGAVLKKRRTGSRSIIGILLLCSILLIGAGTEFPKAAVRDGIAAFEKGEYSDAVRYFENADALLPGTPGILYNLGLSRYMLNDVSGAVYSLRRAATGAPHVPGIRRSLALVENAASLDGQPAVTVVPDPDLWFPGFIGVWNLVFLASLVPPHRRDGRYAIALVGGGLLTVTGILGMGFIDSRVHQAVVVVGPSSAPLQRIPEEDANIWLRLAPGTAVRESARTGEYSLVRTGHGVEGWVESSFLVGEER